MPIHGEVELTCNTPEDVKTRNRAINEGRKVTRFATCPTVQEGEICIVGGGPSLADTLDELRWRKEAGQQVWATNNTFKYLLEHGIAPDAHVLLDARIENKDFIAPADGVTYYLHATCHPSLFDALAGHNVIMYDLGVEGTGLTVGIRALYLAGFSGYRKFHLFGMDSSYRDQQHHAYPQALNDKEPVIEVTVEGQMFRCAPWMAIQAEDFQQAAHSLADQGCVITVAGDGLIPYIAKRLCRMVRYVTAVYDLTVCPPTYDFISFLSEAELYRRKIGAEFIDIVFQPGPVDGFRSDDLPDDYDSRVGMLYRVCMGACRLLRSIRNVDLRKARAPIPEGGDIFPVCYRENPGFQHYGSSHFRTAAPVLKSTNSARKHVARKISGPYVTITLRESSHWPQRNSNLQAWKQAAKFFERHGYQVIEVPDIESRHCNEFSWDTDLRLALYEGAAMNLGVNNGPMCMLFYADVKYIIFKMVTDGIPWCMPEFFELTGMLPGDHHGGRGRIVWEADDYETIVRHASERLGLLQAVA